MALGCHPQQVLLARVSEEARLCWKMRCHYQHFRLHQVLRRSLPGLLLSWYSCCLARRFAIFDAMISGHLWRLWRRWNDHLQYCLQMPLGHFCIVRDATALSAPPCWQYHSTRQGHRQWLFQVAVELLTRYAKVQGWLVPCKFQLDLQKDLLQGSCTCNQLRQDEQHSQLGVEQTA